MPHCICPRCGSQIAVTTVPADGMITCECGKTLRIRAAGQETPPSATSSAPPRLPRSSSGRSGPSIRRRGTPTGKMRWPGGLRWADWQFDNNYLSQLGVSLLVAGCLALLLPHWGLQLRRFRGLGLHASSFGGGMGLLGALSLGLSQLRFPPQAAAIGLGGSLLVAVLWLTRLQEIPNGQPGAVSQAPQNLQPPHFGAHGQSVPPLATRPLAGQPPDPTGAESPFAAPVPQRAVADTPLPAATQALPRYKIAANSEKILDVSPPATGNHWIDRAPADGLLVGVVVARGVDFGGTIDAIRPIYQVADRYVRGQWRGRPTNDQVLLLANPGYVVANIRIRAGLVIDALQLAYAKADREGVRIDDFYLSEFAGGPGGSEQPPPEYPGPIVGLAGFSDVRPEAPILRGLQIVRADTSTTTPKPGNSSR